MEEHRKIDVRIVTPYGLFWEGSCDLLVLPTSDGEQGVMYGHLPFIAALYPGELRLITGEDKRLVFVSAGYTEVRRYEVTVITNAAEWASSIDLKRAQEALLRAQERLDDKANLAAHFIKRNEHAVRRAKARLVVASHANAEQNRSQK